MTANAVTSILLLLTLTGCAASRSPQPTLHSLAAETAPVSPTETTPSLRIVIAATEVPQSVDRPQMLVRTANGELELIERQRWAEPLKRAIPRTLAAQLSAELPNAMVWSSTAAAPADPDLRLLIDVNRFDSSLGKETVLNALWTLKAGEVQRSGRTFARSATSGADYDALVDAHRRNLGALSRDIAAAIRAFTGTHAEQGK